MTEECEELIDLVQIVLALDEVQRLLARRGAVWKTLDGLIGADGSGVRRWRRLGRIANKSEDCDQGYWRFEEGYRPYPEDLVDVDVEGEVLFIVRDAVNAYLNSRRHDLVPAIYTPDQPSTAFEASGPAEWVGEGS